MRGFKRVLSFLLAFLLVFQVTIPAEAATKASSSKVTEVNKKETTIYVGQKVTLKYDNASGKVTWSSNKKSVATVSSKGEVTAVKAGTATITVKKGNCSKV